MRLNSCEHNNLFGPTESTFSEMPSQAGAGVAGEYHPAALCCLFVSPPMRALILQLFTSYLFPGYCTLFSHSFCKGLMLRNYVRHSPESKKHHFRSFASLHCPVSGVANSTQADRAGYLHSEKQNPREKQQNTERGILVLSLISCSVMFTDVMQKLSVGQQAE